MTNWSRVYTLFAGGRLVLEFVSAVDSEIKRRHELQLSDEEVDFLVSTAVHGGLIEHDHEQFRRAERSYINSHGNAVRFEMNIEQYRGPGQEEWGAASCSMVVQNPTSLSKSLPEVEAVQALAALVREFYKYRRLMENSDED